MRQPFWIINISLLLFAFITAGFLYFARPTIPARDDIEPTPYRAPIKMESASFNISKIYEYDLFDTYQKELVAPQEAQAIGALPPPPAPMSVRIPEEPKPQFIEPLPITLKGIIVVLTDDTKNRAIIMDNRTNKEASYKVGDILEDAQLIRIFSNKVILVRSNGQQEVLYLREKDAKLDPTYANIDSWDGIITPTGSYNYIINAPEFINRIQSLAQFIDALEMTTAYKQGENIGSLINNVSVGSLGKALGFSKGDIIQKINDIDITVTTNRLEVYNQIIAMKTNDVIRVTLLRNNKTLTLLYTLEDVHTSRKQEIGQKQPEPNQVTQDQRKILEQKHSFAPTLQEIRNREKSNMIEKGKRPTQNVLSNLNE